MKLRKERSPAHLYHSRVVTLGKTSQSSIYFCVKHRRRNKMFSWCGRGRNTVPLSPHYLNAMSREIRVFLKLPGIDGVVGLHALPRSVLCLLVIAVIFLLL